MKCSKCNKKCLILFDCRCDKKFCSNCKMSETHSCNFDYKKHGREKIEINNQKVINDKLNRI